MDGWMAFSNAWMLLCFSKMVRVQDYLCVASNNLLRRPFLFFSTDAIYDAQCEEGSAFLHSGNNADDYSISVH